MTFRRAGPPVRRPSSTSDVPMKRLALLGLTVLFVLCSLSAFAASLYDQPPFSETELHQFAVDFPPFRAWCAAHGEQPEAVVNEKGEPGIVYSPQAAAYLRAAGWRPERFFCVFGRVAAAVAVVGQEGRITEPMPLEMPGVSGDEIDLVRRNLQELLTIRNQNPPQK